MPTFCSQNVQPTPQAAAYRVHRHPFAIQFCTRRGERLSSELGELPAPQLLREQQRIAPEAPVTVDGVVGWRQLPASALAGDGRELLDGKGIVVRTSVVRKLKQLLHALAIRGAIAAGEH